MKSKQSRRGTKKRARQNKGESPSNEHIFPASLLTPLAIKWKELNAAGRHKEAMETLEQIVVGSTPMFERLAQYEDFHYTVDLPILVSSAQEKMVKWLLRWQPRKGRLFSWLSTCAKNAFRSELVKVNQYRARFHVTGDSLETFYGSEDHEVDKHDLAKDVRNSISDMVCRWGDPQEIGAIRYLIECITDDDHDKQASIRGAAYAYGISLEFSRFFYDWAICELRHRLYDRVYIPFTEQDLFRAVYSHDPILLLADMIPWDLMKKVIVVLQGKRLKIPPLSALAKARADYQLHQDVSRSDLDPDSIAEVARKHRKTHRSASEIFEQMSATLDPKRYGEHEIFGDDRDS